jgi:hypothetical protein
MAEQLTRSGSSKKAEAKALLRYERATFSRAERLRFSLLWYWGRLRHRVAWALPGVLDFLSASSCVSFATLHIPPRGISD